MTELPNGWHLTTIGEVCEKPKYGWTTSASDIGEVKLLRTTDLTHGPITWETVPFCKEIPKTVADYLVHPNDIFISRAGSVGVSVLVKDAPYKSVFASYLIRIRPNKKIDSKYLSLFLQSPHYWNQVTELSSGIALANINATKIQSINLPLPPLPEQQKIVEILEDHLSRLDAALADVKQAKVKAAQFRRSLLQAAFTGNLMGDGTRLMTEWPVSNLGDLCTFITDGSHNPPKGVEQSDFYMLSSRDIQNGKLTFEKPRYLNAQDFAVENKRTDVKVGDVLLTTVGTIGRTAIYNGTPEHVTFQRSVSVLRPNQQKISSKFLKYFLDSITEYLNREARGVAQQGIYLNQVRKLSVPIPPTDKQNKIVEVLEDHLSRLDASVAIADAMEKQSSSLRRSLLQAAFTGQLTKEVASV